jgi:NAD-dependent SIR2 family protein deacetylase
MGVAEKIKEGKCHNIVVLCGAGVSCSAGIPDFRTPGGKYNTQHSTFRLGDGYYWLSC